MVLTMQYEQSIPTKQLLLFKTGAYTYEVIYPKQLDNGTTNQIVRQLGKRTINFSTTPPAWGTESTIDVETPSGLTNPIAPNRGIIGYDFELDEILLALGEWNGASSQLESTTVKLLSIKRDFSSVTVKHSDLFSLVQTVAADATAIKYYVHFYGYGGKIVGAVGTYADTSERSVIVLYDGTTWSAVRANTRYDGVQELIEPIWDASDNFLGWLTEGHGTNSHFIDYSDLSITAGAPGGAYTTEPIYDPINHQIIWLEWGSELGYTQSIWTADPTTPFTATDVTPSGTITDNEANSIDLTTVNKSSGTIFSDGTNNWLVLQLRRGGIPEEEARSAKINLGNYNDATAWEILADPSNVDTWRKSGRCRAIDLTNKLFLPSPMFQVIPSTVI